VATGITYPIHDGEEGFGRNEFLIRMAHQYGFAFNQREGSIDAPIRRDDAAEDVERYEQNITKAQAAIKELDEMDAATASNKAVEEFSKLSKQWVDEREELKAMRARYLKMLVEVEAWEVEPVIQYIKDGALKALLESMDWDTGTEEDVRMREHPTPQTGQEWIASRRSTQLREIDYYTKARDERLARERERNEHIDALYRALNK
jgi:hypothetical protein